MCYEPRCNTFFLFNFREPPSYAGKIIKARIQPYICGKYTDFFKKLANIYTFYSFLKKIVDNFSNI